LEYSALSVEPIPQSSAGKRANMTQPGQPTGFEQRQGIDEQSARKADLRRRQMPGEKSAGTGLASSFSK
jgi:hypothetical protein